MRAQGRLGRFRRQVQVGPERVAISYLDLPGEGVPIVLIHGATGCAVQWEGQAERLAGRHRVLAVDLRGHGLSDKPANGYGTEDFMSDVLSWIEAVDLGPRFRLVGHSFGGYLATLVATRFPARVERLVLMNTTGNVKHLGMVPRTAVRMPFVLMNMVHRAIPVLVSTPPLVARRLVAEALAEWECWHLYPCIECPTLVATGTYDPIAPPSHARRIAELVPDARLHVVGWSRHMTMIERGRAVADLLEGFLSSEKHAAVTA